MHSRDDWVGLWADSQASVVTRVGNIILNTCTCGEEAETACLTCPLWALGALFHQLIVPDHQGLFIPPMCVAWPGWLGVRGGGKWSVQRAYSCTEEASVIGASSSLEQHLL